MTEVDMGVASRGFPVEISDSTIPLGPGGVLWRVSPARSWSLTGRLRHDVPMTPVEIAPHLFTAIDHVGIAVADLDEAIAYYRDTFGLHVAHEETNEEQGVREAMLAVGESGSHIQLLAPLNGDSTIAKFIQRSGPGMQQLAYRVTDVDAVSAILRERGVRLLYDAPRRGTSGSRINFIHPKDAGGVLVELVEPATAH
jgi:methylmalonyl-CoA/ethylmalonyl-CoA epimerase